MTLQRGTRLGSYEIVSLLGSGGMGEVYRAKDLKLGRDVAIKVLREEIASDSERLRRFKQEARSASALNHPNIITIHDIGQHEATPYIAMEFVDGKTLRELLADGRLSTKKMLQLVAQIAEGLAKAHSAGIVHRDLKPENLMVTADGYVKILDFGLAKLLPETFQVGSEIETWTQGTRDGVLVGTVQYMSPEQAAGRRVDHRSDQFALGSIIYEMVAGKPAFLRDTVPQTLSAVNEQEPEPMAAIQPETPAHLRVIVERCLAKNPEERYDSTRDLARELKSIGEIATPSDAKAVPAETRRRWPRVVGIVGGVAAVLAVAVLLSMGVWRIRLMRDSTEPSIDSIAVLPLENLSGDPEQEYFSDGLTEELIAELAKIAALRVISRQSVMQFKDTVTPLPEIAQVLNVDALIEGSVRRSGNRVRVTTQLVKASPERHLWAETYDRDLQDILTLQSEIAQAIVEEIQIAVTPEVKARFASERPVHPEAHEAYLLGRYHHNRTAPDDLTRAIRYFRKAIEKDPDFALPYAYLSHSLSLAAGPIGPLFPTQQAMKEARTNADRAITIDPELSEAYSALGLVLQGYREWPAAEKAYKKAVELNPGSVLAHQGFSTYLSKMDRPREALAEIRKAMDLDPLNLTPKVHHGMLLHHAREYDQAIRQLESVIDLNSRLPQPHRMLGLIYLDRKRYDDAIEEHQQAVALTGGRSSNHFSFLGGAYAVAGKRTEAIKILREMENLLAQGQYVNPFARFYIYYALGDVDEALSWFERCIDEHHELIGWLKVWPHFDPLRNDSRFQGLLHRMNFPP